MAGAKVDVVVADVGNTSLKLVAFDGAGEAVHARRVPAAMAEPPPGTTVSTPVVAVSVSDRGLRALEGRGPGREWPAKVLLLGRDFPLRVEDRTESPGTTGHDRLCAAVAAHERTGGAAVVVGAGTALTVDVVGAGGEFLGGAIAPGLGAAAAGLAGAAPRLPRPDLAPSPVAYPGRTTAEALRAGAVFGYAGAVHALVALARRAAAGSGGDPSSVPVLLHGGDAETVRAGWPDPGSGTPPDAHPRLVAEGARLLWIRAGRPT